MIDAETKTGSLSGVNIDTNITRRELVLRSGLVNVNRQILNNISDINR